MFSFFARPTTSARTNLGVEVLEARDVPAICDWVGNGQTEQWDDAGNWKAGVVPVIGDTVFIDYDDDTKSVVLIENVTGISCDLRRGTLYIGAETTFATTSFSQSGGTVIGAGTLSTSKGDFSGGTQSGKGTTIVAANGTADFSTPDGVPYALQLAGSRTFRIEGQATQRSGVDIRLVDTSVLQVASNATYTVEDFGAGTVRCIEAGAGAGMRLQIDSGGRFVNADSGDLFQIKTPVLSRGTIDVGGQNATTAIYAASDLGGTIRIASTSDLKVTSSAQSSLGGGIGGAGLTIDASGLAGGTLVLAGSHLLDGTVSAKNSVTISIPEGVELSGAGTLSLEAGASLNSVATKFAFCGTLSIGQNAKWSILPSSVPNATTELVGVQLVNAGSIDWSGTNIVLGDGAGISNQANATFLVSADKSSKVSLTGLAGTDFLNAGTLKFSNVDHEQDVAIGIRVMNSGTVYIGEGTKLQLTVALGNIGAGQKSSLVSTGGQVLLKNSATLEAVVGVYIDGGEFNYITQGTVIAPTFTLNKGKLRCLHTDPARLDITGDFVIGGAAKVYIRASGTGANEVDLLAVTGKVTFAGSLIFTAIGTFDPKAGDIVKPITFGQTAGKFVAFQGVPNNAANYNATDFTLEWPAEPPVSTET